MSPPADRIAALEARVAALEGAISGAQALSPGLMAKLGRIVATQAAAGVTLPKLDALIALGREPGAD